MSTADTVQKATNHSPIEHRIEVGQYGQNMYYIDTVERVSDSNQDMINAMLLKNQAVGIIGGYFDDRLTVCMISGLACKTLGYDSPEEFLLATNSQLLNMTVESDEPDFVRSRLMRPQNEAMGCYLKGKDGKAISLRMGNAVAATKTGKEMWYISIRRLGEMYHDSLTDGYNRRGFINYITNLKNSGVDLRNFAVICINIKGFKAINDLYGSEFGDTLLVNAYKHFSGCEMKPVVCARREADKFLMLVKKDNLHFDKLSEELKITYTYGDKDRYVDCVCGIYLIDNEEMSISTMLDCAKIAKEKVSDAFIKPYVVFEPSMKTDYLSHVNALSQFEDALLKNEFKVYYQPVVDCKTGLVVSAEALIRWETKDGILSPGVFIPAFEENGCIVKLDEYVLTKVIRHLRSKVESNAPIVPISVNLSRMDFFDNERTDRLYGIFKNDPIVRRFVHFEITETSYLSVKEKQAEFIKNINALGGMVYIDDFGVANSSIDMLSQYDFGVLKLDMRFIREMEKNEKVYTLVKTTIHMAHELHMRVVAEGVETENQLSLLRATNCDYIQGYYFSKPLDEQSFTTYLHQHI